MASPTILADDLPWPELGNVSRGATRGNQGQKGVLGPPDQDGCCLLQLRVQPGVLEVKLNRQSSDWYRTLDNEVNRALKLTKTYWRKARRRQDYDSRGDQDHMVRLSVSLVGTVCPERNLSPIFFQIITKSRNYTSGSNSSRTRRWHT